MSNIKSSYYETGEFPLLRTLYPGQQQANVCITHRIIDELAFYSNDLLYKKRGHRGKRYVIQ